MNDVMTEIKLYGVLAKKFGKTHQRLISTKHEATRALAATIDGFENFMRSSKKRGLTFALFYGERNISEDDLSLPVSGEVIKIIPVVIGSKKAGLLQTILGAVLVVAGLVLSPYTAGLSTAMIGSGVALMAGGVIQLLSPQTAGLASKQDSANKASYAFGSPTNTASQGYPVGLLYGQRRIGGAIISAGIYVEDQQ
ncbi:tail assembly protein [Pantoea stewartii]|uniref:Phage tail protein n=1 Tax=Pantoea stewartii subsp. stewartii DC283 TaxID=660596 RepID=A0ABM6K7J0_PANSE|nr:tail assembly protein [Pantoea stewartii]ARF50783.1 phage tail protein [Pantoea stewartii subsp. stewartii DC283]